MDLGTLPPLRGVSPSESDKNVEYSHWTAPTFHQNVGNILHIKLITYSDFKVHQD